MPCPHIAVFVLDGKEATATALGEALWDTLPVKGDLIWIDKAKYLVADREWGAVFDPRTNTVVSSVLLQHFVVVHLVQDQGATEVDRLRTEVERITQVAIERLATINSLRQDERSSIQALDEIYELCGCGPEDDWGQPDEVVKAVEDKFKDFNSMGEDALALLKTQEKSTDEMRALEDDDEEDRKT